MEKLGWMGKSGPNVGDNSLLGQFKVVQKLSVFEFVQKFGLCFFSLFIFPSIVPL